MTVFRGFPHYHRVLVTTLSMNAILQDVDNHQPLCRFPRSGFPVLLKRSPFVRDVAVAIIQDENWKDVLRHWTQDEDSEFGSIRETPLRKLIKRLPDVAEEVPI